MPDRTINFGDDAADARYRIQDTSSTGGDLVLAEDLDGGTVLLEYDYSASEWVSRGPVNLDGNDITNAGSITADTLEADAVDTEVIENESVAAGSQQDIVRRTDSGEISIIEVNNRVNSVETSATEILNVGSNRFLFGGQVMVHGNQNNNDRFMDIVHFATGVETTVQSSVDRASPASRTYSTGFSPDRLDLSMGAGSYDVVIEAKIMQVVK